MDYIILICQIFIRILGSLFQEIYKKNLGLKKIVKPWLLKSNLAVIEFLLCADH